MIYANEQHYCVLKVDGTDVCYYTLGQVDLKPKVEFLSEVVGGEVDNIHIFDVHEHTVTYLDYRESNIVPMEKCSVDEFFDRFVT